LLIEGVGHMTHRAHRAHAGAIGRDDTRAFLPAMLERVQPEVGQIGGLGISENSEDAAFVPEFIQHVFRVVPRLFGSNVVVKRFARRTPRSRRSAGGE
jgi:hypothetical protein